MQAKRETLSEQLRRAIIESPFTQYRIAKELGIYPSTLNRFVHGHRGLPLNLIDRLGELLGLRLVVDAQAEATTGGDGTGKGSEMGSKRAKSAKGSRSAGKGKASSRRTEKHKGA